MPEQPSPDTFEYFPEQPNTESSAVAWYLFISPLLVAIVVAVIDPDWAVPSLVLTTSVLWYRRRKARKQPHSILMIRNERLIVTDGNERPLINVPLNELEDVTLDTKTIQKVQENLSSGIPDLRFIDSRVGPEIDNSRIELVTTETTLRLTKHYTSSTDATDWFAKIRRFLRQHGWHPRAERESQR